jgi:hypothetical protein
MVSLPELTFRDIDLKFYMVIVLEIYETSLVGDGNFRLFPENLKLKLNQLTNLAE